MSSASRPDPPDEMERARAARSILDMGPHARRCQIAAHAGVSQEDLELVAFMDIFHPGHPATDGLARDARLRQCGRRA